MIRARRSSLRLLSIAVGLLFTAGIYYSMHYRIPWAWDAPGIGKLPVEIVNAFLEEAYEKGDGTDAVRDYFAPDIAAEASTPQERTNGDRIPHKVRSTVAQGLTVVIFQHIGAARGEPAADVVDVFGVRDGRIIRRERYRTNFGE